jgi:hypothetical protein
MTEKVSGSAEGRREKQQAKTPARQVPSHIKDGNSLYEEEQRGNLFIV